MPPDPRLAYYGSRPDPNGRGTLVKTADGREALFLTAPGQAYTPGPAPTPPPGPVEAPDRTGYEPADVTAMRHLAEGRAARERQDAAMAPLRLEDIARQRREGVAQHIGGIAPGSPEARIEEGKRVVDRPGEAAKTFARSAAVGALDTAALPVTLPARAARAAGVPGLDGVADLQADEALQDATWLASGEEAGQYRKRVAKEREDFPTVADAGAEAGAGLVAAPLGGAARGLRRGVGGVRVASSAAQAPASAQQGAYARGGQASDAEIGASAVLGAGAGMAGVTEAGAGARNVAKTKDGKIRLWRAAEDDYVTDSASFAESKATAREYLDNPGFGGRKLFRADVEVDPDRVLDLTAGKDPVARVSDLLGKEHPGAIGVDEYVPRVSYDLRDAGYDWVKVPESYPEGTTTWVWVGGDDPEMVEIE